MTREEKKEELIGLFSTGAIFIGDLIDECFDFADEHPVSDLENTEGASLDWEQRRYEIAKAMLPELHNSYAGSTDWQCQQAVIFADRLINELKKQN